jgi:Arc/MetJ family transcription regulator
MRTNIDIDDELMKQAMKATGASTKKAAVEASMQLAIRLKAQEGIKKLRGKVKWEGDLAAMREGRFLKWEVETKADKRKSPDA